MVGEDVETHVSLTPQMLDEPLAISMIRSESMSIPPAAPGTIQPNHACQLCSLTQTPYRPFNRFELTVVDHDGDRRGLGDIDKVLLQGFPAQSSGIVSRGDDDGEIGAGLGGFFAELDRSLGRADTTVRSRSGTSMFSVNCCAEPIRGEMLRRDPTHVPAMIVASFNPASSRPFRAALIKVVRSSFVR